MGRATRSISPVEVRQLVRPEDIPSTWYTDDVLAVTISRGLVVIWSGISPGPWQMRSRTASSAERAIQGGEPGRLVSSRWTHQACRVAKDDATHEALSEKFARARFQIVRALGQDRDQNVGKIEASIGRNKHNRLRMKIATQRPLGVSLWKVRQRSTNLLADVEIKTAARTNTRPLAYITPVVGDEILRGRTTRSPTRI